MNILQNLEFLLAIDDINQLDTPVFQDLFKDEEAKGIIFVGRSNVGKSTLINTLFGRKLAKTSKTPGRTQKIIIFKGIDPETKKSHYLFDLPGHGHAKVSKKMMAVWGELIHHFFQLIPENFLVVSIQDARHPFEKTDRDFWEYIQGIPGPKYLILNKLDKLKTQKEKSLLNKKMRSSEFKEISATQVFMVSCHSKKGIPELEQSLKAYFF